MDANLIDTSTLLIINTDYKICKVFIYSMVYYDCLCLRTLYYGQSERKNNEKFIKKYFISFLV